MIPSIRDIAFIDPQLACWRVSPAGFFSHYRKEPKIMNMSINGLTCVFNMPEAVKTKHKDGVEAVCCLPPYAKQPAYAVDDYPACPANWMHGSARASSYFVAIEEGKGMWLDFNGNNSHKHDVAVLLSIQGINPLTGKKTEKMALEQYKNNCPQHDVPFQQDRFCPECGYKWPAQNYLSTTGQNGGTLWLDGFRAEDGVIRQYVFTSEQIKGVAAQLIGEERVFAIGVAFFLSKEPKKVVPPTIRSRGFVPISFNGVHHDPDLITLHNAGGQETWSSTEVLHLCSSPKVDSARNRLKNDSPRLESLKCYEIGAGAKISQSVNADPQELSYWQETPYFLYINYVDKETCQKIIDAGKRDTTKGGEGFLTDVEKVSTGD
jgi:hypothetical protein